MVCFIALNFIIILTNYNTQWYAYHQVLCNVTESTLTTIGLKYLQLKLPLTLNILPGTLEACVIT